MAICSFDNCSKQAIFAHLKNDKLKYCKTHSSEDMIDVINKRCAHLDCNKISPNFAYSKSDKFKYCKSHKADNMVDVINKRCAYQSCNSINPIFAYTKNDELKFCKAHKVEDMLDIRHKRCAHPSCDHLPTFAYSKSDEFKYCKSHKAEDMVDIASKRCAHLGCRFINPVFANTKNDKLKFCKTHKAEDMVDVKSKKCTHPGCDSRPVFAYFKSDELKFCKAHKAEDMIDVLSKRCVSCGLFHSTKSKDYMCHQCFMFNNPNHEFSRHYKTKELTFTKQLQDDLYKQGIECVLDSKIAGGCSRRRPDVFVDLLTHVLIIEIDENQHLSYNETCEYVRTIELNEDIGHRPMYIIRLNPDSYKLNGKSVRGCFDSKMKLNKKEFEHRYSILLSTVLDLTATLPERLIESIELFFTESD